MNDRLFDICRCMKLFLIAVRQFPETFFNSFLFSCKTACFAFSSNSTGYFNGTGCCCSINSLLISVPFGNIRFHSLCTRISCNADGISNSRSTVSRSRPPEFPADCKPLGQRTFQIALSGTLRLSPDKSPSSTAASCRIPKCRTYNV